MIKDIPTEIYFFPKFLAHKLENIASPLCAEFNADSKTVLVFLLALIVFDFSYFECSKTHFTGEANIYIYILYAYIEYYYGVLNL